MNQLTVTVILLAQEIALTGVKGLVIIPAKVVAHTP